ncbi:MAG: uracil-DNA glycosylase, partial [Lachnospiraceae bacterium]|nr:uracil-DNA glycosylase [Lachnospiraceae bacterium]
PQHGNLTGWAKQGVLLLNTTLTVRRGVAHSHKELGWEPFTDAVIRHIDEKKEATVFLLWGRPAQQKARLIQHSNHLVLAAAHPSPLSAYRGFFGCRHFSKANAFLQEHGREPIDWQIE